MGTYDWTNIFSSINNQKTLEGSRGKLNAVNPSNELHYQPSGYCSSELLSTILDSFPGGICVFNSELKMISYNQNLLHLLEYPKYLFEDDLPTMEYLFRFNALRGEYGEGDVEEMIQERLTRAKLRKEHSYERQRPNGVVLNVRGAPIKAGGFLTTYFDVTERY